MSNYRRVQIPGGTFFFTVKTEQNAPIFAEQQFAALLGEVVREVMQLWPFELNAIVLLPDHLHAIWSLPPGDMDYPKRWGWLKKEFTKRYLELGGQEQSTSTSRKRYRRRGVWQRRYWEHTIADDADFETHFDYVHWNPVKHKYVSCPVDWPYSSFHRWVAKGVYEKDWGCGHKVPLAIKQSAQDFGE